MMTKIVVINKKGQITIPLVMRKALGMFPSVRVKLEIKNNSLIVTPVKLLTVA